MESGKESQTKIGSSIWMTSDISANSFNNFFKMWGKNNKLN